MERLLVNIWKFWKPYRGQIWKVQKKKKNPFSWFAQVQNANLHDLWMFSKTTCKKICTIPQMHKMKQRTGLYTEFMLDNWAIHRSYQMTHCSHRVSISHNFNSILLVIRGSTVSNKLQYKLNYFSPILCSFGFQRTKLMVSKSNSTIK